MPIAEWKRARDERYIAFKIRVMEADFIRSRLARARRAGTGVATLSATLTGMALGVHLRLMLQAYGFPEGMAAEVGGAIDNFILQDGDDFKQYAYAAPTETDWRYWTWLTVGDSLSCGLFWLGLTPYWSWLLSSCLLWSTAIAFAFRQWSAAIAIPVVYAWLYVYYREVLVKAMGDDAALLQSGLYKLANDAHLYRVQLQTVLWALRDRGLTVLK